MESEGTETDTMGFIHPKQMESKNTEAIIIVLIYFLHFKMCAYLVLLYNTHGGLSHPRGFSVNQR